MDAHANRIEVDLEVGSDRIIDFFLLQNHTPSVTVAGAPARMLPALASQRTAFLEEFCGWARETLQSKPEDRLVLFVAPELSLPTSSIQVLKDFGKAATRPFVFIAGLEFVEWEEFSVLLEHEVSSFPGKKRLSDYDGDNQFVNAAIVAIRNRVGQFDLFLQPKRNLSNPEVPHVFRCPEILLFASRKQGPGSRMNFAVQICADFTSASCVRDFRKACAAEAPGLPLDFTFVLQWNENQDATQWKQAAAEYFSPADDAAATNEGALVFVNNSNARPGKTAEWGRSSFLFHINWKWKAEAPPTYWLDEQLDFDHQAAVMRERGPFLFWLNYKPHYLVRRRPGGRQPEPFVASQALATPLREDQFRPDRFRPIQPVSHWLASEWQHGRPRFEDLLGEAGLTAEELAGTRLECLEQYDVLLDGWREAFGRTDALARQTANTYFECIQAPQFPNTSAEPNAWCDQAGLAAQRLHAVLALMSLAGRQCADFALRPSPARVSHAVTASEIPITLLWGAGDRPVRSMFATYFAAVRSRSALDEIAPRAILVLVEPRDAPASASDATELVRARLSATLPRPGKGVPSHLSVGSAVDPTAEAEISCICDSHIFRALAEAAYANEQPGDAILGVVKGVLD